MFVPKLALAQRLVVEKKLIVLKGHMLLSEAKTSWIFHSLMMGWLILMMNKRANLQMLKFKNEMYY